MEEDKREFEEAVDADFSKIEDPENPETEQEKKPGFFENLAEKRRARQEERARKKQEKAELKQLKQEQKLRKKEERKARWEAGKKKRRRILFGVIILLVLILIAGGAIYYRYVQFFTTHFYNGTTINGTDVSYQTVEEVKTGIEETVAEYELTIITKDTKEVLTAEDVGWEYVDDRKVDELLAGQDPWTWITHVSNPEYYEISAGTTYDKKKTEAVLKTLECLTGEITEPVDASLVLGEDGTYEITPEVEGNLIDEEKLKETVMKALDRSKNQVNIEDEDCYVHPAVYSDDKQIIKRRDDWNKYLSISISYKFGDRTETVDANTIKGYLRDNGEELVLSTDWINSLVYSWSAKYDSYGAERTFTKHDGTELIIPAGGDYGWSLNRQKMIEDLTQAIENGESGAREPIWLMKAMGWDNNDLTGTYLEVSLEEQKLYLYENQQLILESDIVTGGFGNETLTGIYSIDVKEEEAKLSLEDTNKETGEVSYWMAFNGKQGILDAAWRNSFGGTEYQTNGTNGNINVPEDKMQMIYETLEIGSAVVIY